MFLCIPTYGFTHCCGFQSFCTALRSIIYCGVPSFSSLFWYSGDVLLQFTALHDAVVLSQQSLVMCRALEACLVQTGFGGESVHLHDVP